MINLHNACRPSYIIKSVTKGGYRVSFIDKHGTSWLSKKSFKFKSDIAKLVSPYAAPSSRGPKNGEYIMGWMVEPIPEYEVNGKRYKARDELIVIVTELKDYVDDLSKLGAFIESDSRPLRPYGECVRDDKVRYIASYILPSLRRSFDNGQ